MKVSHHLKNFHILFLFFLLFLMVLRNEWMEDLGEKKKFFHAEDIKSNYSSDYLKKFTSLLLLMELSSTFHKHKQKKRKNFMILCYVFSSLTFLILLGWWWEIVITKMRRVKASFVFFPISYSFFLFLLPFNSTMYFSTS